MLGDKMPSALDPDPAQWDPDLSLWEWRQHSITQRWRDLAAIRSGAAGNQHDSADLLIYTEPSSVSISWRLLGGFSLWVSRSCSFHTQRIISWTVNLLQGFASLNRKTIHVSLVKSNWWFSVSVSLQSVTKLLLSIAALGFQIHTWAISEEWLDLSKAQQNKTKTKTKHSPFTHFTNLQSQALRRSSSQCPHALKTDSSFIHSLNYVTFIQSWRLHLITPGNSERKGDSISVINPTSHHLLSCFNYPNIYRSHIPTTSVQLETGFQVYRPQEKT